MSKTDAFAAVKNVETGIHIYGNIKYYIKILIIRK